MSLQDLKIEKLTVIDQKQYQQHVDVYHQFKRVKDELVWWLGLVEKRQSHVEEYAQYLITREREKDFRLTWLAAAEKALMKRKARGAA